MTKKELIQHLQGKAPGLTQTDINNVLDHLACTAQAELVQNGEITLPGIGKLAVKEAKAREGRNPNTGEAIHIPAKKHIRFKAFKNLSDGVRG